MDAYSFPKGLVGDVAQYIFDSSIKPAKEVALAGAIALCAGIAGRAFNISGSGLNHYLILLARTGRGKEGAATGIDNIIGEVQKKYPTADQFMGPANFASGQALIKSLDSKRCFVSVLGEFGLMLQQMCDHRANPALVMLKRMLLDIFGKSGHNKILRPTAYSDSEKNTKLVQSPNVTILGESTPENFYESLDESHIAEGLIPRFSIIEYTGIRNPTNPNKGMMPSDKLVSDVGTLVTIASTNDQSNIVNPVAMNSEAEKMMNAFDVEADNKINCCNSGGVDSELWNRAHLKALKLAALIAVGINPHIPIISPEVAQWAIDFVKREIFGIVKRFQTGGLGSGEKRQDSEVLRLFEHFQNLDADQKLKNRCPLGLLDKAIIPAAYLGKYTGRLSCFRNAPRGARAALRETLDNLVEREALALIPEAQLQTEFGTRMKIYIKGVGFDSYQK